MLKLICEGVPHQFLGGGAGGTQLVVSSDSENVFLPVPIEGKCKLNLWK